MTDVVELTGQLDEGVRPLNKKKKTTDVDDEVVSSVGRGLCVLIGISRYDTPKEVEYIVRKILNLRLFDDDNGKRWSKSVMDKDYDVLCVSQFTLNVTLKGNKPDFHEAMKPDLSEQFYNTFLDHLRDAYKPEKIKDGRFGAYMQVNIQNDGPVTVPLEAVPSGPSCSGGKGKKGGGDQGPPAEEQDQEPSV